MERLPLHDHRWASGRAGGGRPLAHQKTLLGGQPNVNCSLAPPLRIGFRHVLDGPTLFELIEATLWLDSRGMKEDVLTGRLFDKTETTVAHEFLNRSGGQSFVLLIPVGAQISF
jgi:hypothetical protein